MVCGVSSLSENVNITKHQACYTTMRRVKLDSDNVKYNEMQ